MGGTGTGWRTSGGASGAGGTGPASSGGAGAGGGHSGGQNGNPGTGAGGGAPAGGSVGAGASVVGVDYVASRETKKKIEALGADFDPEYHDALAHIPSDLPENKVAAIIQNGYTMHDKVIRHVKVAVSKGNETIADIKINIEE